MPLWYVDYSDLKAIKILWAPEKFLPTLLNYLEEFELGVLPVIRDYQK